MSFFVLIYDRDRQDLVELREFQSDQLATAEAFRLDALRRALRAGLDREIVLFQASSREALERSHGSYFFSEEELLERVKEAADGAQTFR